MPEPTVPSPRIPIVPAVFFGMVLGLGGLGSAWRVAARLWGLPTSIGEALSLTAAAIWCAWLALFAAKWIGARQTARREAADPVMSFSIGLIAMATLLVSVALKPYAPSLAWWIFAIGLVAGLAFAVWLMGSAWQGARTVAATTPLMYLTPVGAGYLGAIGAGGFGHIELATMLWGTGAIAWLFIESAVLQRLMTEPMPVPLRATVGIQLAPPAVGCMSYLAFTDGPPDRLAQFLFGYALLQGLILLRLTPWLRQQQFGPGAWAYTFGVAALAVSSLVMLVRGNTVLMSRLAPLLFAAANLLIGWIAARTLLLALNGKLFPPPP